ncbi:MAG: gliding motility-associated protein GldC [Limisphaerales bacterium]|jgi:gliding motility-associated protein GldC
MSTSDKNEGKNRSTINFEVEMDENKVPESIKWAASDSTRPEPQACEAIMISLWDKQAKEALRIDLWTKDMQKDDMDMFIFQTIMTLSDTYTRANGDAEVAELIKEMGYQFGEKTKLIERNKSE